MQVALTRVLPIVLVVHDEIVVEVPEADAEFAATLVEAAMIEAGQVYLKRVPVVVDVNILDGWKDD